MIFDALNKLSDLKSMRKLVSQESDFLAGGSGVGYKLQLILKTFERLNCLM